MKIEQYLKKNNKSITKERKEIFSFINSKHIFSSLDILNNFENIWRASVFRTIKLFLDIWIIRRVWFWDREEKYEVNDDGNHHEHMKCSSCNCIISFSSEDICSKIFEAAKKKGFKIQEHSIWVIWTCSNCS